MDQEGRREGETHVVEAPEFCAVSAPAQPAADNAKPASHFVHAIPQARPDAGLPVGVVVEP